MNNKIHNSAIKHYLVVAEVLLNRSELFGKLCLVLLVSTRWHHWILMFHVTLFHADIAALTPQYLFDIITF